MCVSLSLCVWLCVALTTCCRLLSFFFLPLEPRADARSQRRSRNWEQREDGGHYSGLFISPLWRTTPTALPPALTCQPANVGSSHWCGYREEHEEEVCLTVKLSVRSRSIFKACFYLYSEINRQTIAYYTQANYWWHINSVFFINVGPVP